jgi:hypothetical protein
MLPNLQIGKGLPPHRANGANKIHSLPISQFLVIPMAVQCLADFAPLARCGGKPPFPTCKLASLELSQPTNAPLPPAVCCSCRLLLPSAPASCLLPPLFPR